VSTDLARRRSLLTAALGFALLDTRGQPVPPEVSAIGQGRTPLLGIPHKTEWQ